MRAVNIVTVTTLRVPTYGSEITRQAAVTHFGEGGDPAGRADMGDGRTEDVPVSVQ